MSRRLEQMTDSVLGEARVPLCADDRGSVRRCARGLRTPGPTWLARRRRPVWGGDRLPIGNACAIRTGLDRDRRWRHGRTSHWTNHGWNQSRPLEFSAIRGGDAACGWWPWGWTGCWRRRWRWWPRWRGRRGHGRGFSPPGFNPRPAEARTAPDSSTSPTNTAGAGRGGRGGGAAGGGRAGGAGWPWRSSA